MDLKDAHRSNVLVQTQGNIVVNVEREPTRVSAVRLLLIRSRPILLGSALVAFVGFSLAEQAHLVDKRERRGLTRLDQLEAQIQVLSKATELQEGHVERMVQKIDHVNNDVAALPAMIEATVQRSTSSLVDAMSNLQLRPSFQSLYVAASGFQSDVETTPAKVQPASVAKPTDAEPRRHRQPSFRRSFGRSYGLTPTNTSAAGAALGQEDGGPAPVSEP